MACAQSSYQETVVVVVFFCFHTQHVAYFELSPGVIRAFKNIHRNPNTAEIFGHNIFVTVNLSVSTCALGMCRFYALYISSVIISAILTSWDVL